METGRTQYKFIYGMRALAALIVVFGHTIASVATPYMGTDPNPINIAIQEASQYAVVCFLVISGFCLGQIFQGAPDTWPRYRTFILKRSVRILIPYAAAMGISYLLACTVLSTPSANIWDNSIPITGFGVLTHILMIHDVFTQTLSNGNYPLWTIAVEWRIYFLAPLFAFCLVKYGRMKAVLIAVLLTIFVCAGVIVIRAQGQEWITANICGLSPQFILVFFMGFLVAHILSGRGKDNDAFRNEWMWIRVMLCLAVIIFEFGNFLVGQRFHQAFMVLDIGVALGFAILIYYCAVAQNFIKTLLETKPLVVLGTASYSLYLIHAPVIELVRRVMGVPIEPILTNNGYMFIGVAITAAVAAAGGFYLLIEKPSHRFARSLK